MMNSDFINEVCMWNEERDNLKYTSSLEYAMLDEELDEFMDFKRNDITLNDSTNNDLEKDINSIIKKYKNVILNNTRFTGERVLMSIKFQRVHSSVKFTSNPKTPNVHARINIINKMLD